MTMITYFTGWMGAGKTDNVSQKKKKKKNGKIQNALQMKGSVWSQSCHPGSFPPSSSFLGFLLGKEQSNPQHIHIWTLPENTEGWDSPH